MSQDNEEARAQKVRKFEDLKARAQKFNEGAIKVNTQIENSHENLQKAKELLNKRYEMNDLEALKKLALEWERQDAEIIRQLEQDVISGEAEIMEKTNLIKQIQNY